VDNSEEFRCISLCTGYAGIELGLREVIPNLRTVVYVEVEAFAVANLVAKIEEGKLDAAPIWTDIKTFDGEPFRDRVHLITGGYPCQPFSVAGKRKGEADPRHLWPDIERIIKAVRPLYGFFENVAGHLTAGFPTVYRSLRNMGYSVEAGLFTAAECGLNHQRERLYFLAYSTSKYWDELPPTHTREVFEQKIWMQQLRGQNMPIDDSLWGEQGKYVFEPRICRRDDGGPISLDRRRLLGNGVVPQCAAKAWRYLK
jgi:site-specific DNA-cytosine methylase